MTKQKNLQKISSATLCLIASLTLVAKTVLASEIVISGNGNGSESVVQSSFDSEASVQQSNTITINNDINTQASTGQNSSSGNTTSETSIQTGDSSENIGVKNDVNSSNVSLNDCCRQDTNVLIVGNGDESNNLAGISLTSQTHVEVSQQANINNTLSGSASTGENEVSGNSADVSIGTGNIKVFGEIQSGPLNSSDIKLGSGNDNLSIKIVDNGSGSENDVHTSLVNDIGIFINSASDVDNYVLWDLETGKNSVNENKGDVNISSGDIDFKFLIGNLANLGGVEISCCPSVFDPGSGGEQDDNDEDEEENEESEEEDNDDEDEADNEDESGGEVLPEAAATSAGGPGIAGLSDTNSNNTWESLFFILGLTLISLGGRIIVNEIFTPSPEKRL